MSWQDIIKAPREKERFDVNKLNSPIDMIYNQGGNSKPSDYFDKLKKDVLKSIEDLQETLYRGKELSRAELNDMEERLKSTYEVSDFNTELDEMSSNIHKMIVELDKDIMEVVKGYLDLFDSVGEGEARMEADAERAWGAERERIAEGW
jgi:hypothetical protein